VGLRTRTRGSRLVDIARALDCSPDTVLRIEQRALRKVRDNLTRAGLTFQDFAPPEKQPAHDVEYSVEIPQRRGEDGEV